MSKCNLIAVRLVSGFLLTVAFFAMGSFSNVKAADNPDDTDELYPPSAPPSARALTTLAPRALFALPTPTPGETLAYFFPTDNDATGTVMFLLNTDSVDHTVALRGFNHDGAMVYAQNINVPAASMRRLISDSVAANPPPSWSGPNSTPPYSSGVDNITTNFTDFVYFASVSLPKGVKVDGYTIFNPGTGTVDPRKDQGAIPLRFMTGPFYLP
jgi:hypothetical protein